MSDNSHIEWTDATWNPTTGCTKVSPGCDHCYIERTPPFRMQGRKFLPLDVTTGASTGVQLHHDRLAQPLRWRKPRRVFVNSLSDLFHEHVPEHYIARVFGVMAAAREHTFQALTKRHARMRSLLTSEAFREQVFLSNNLDQGDVLGDDWPLPNVWLGVSVENQRWADIRIPALLDTPAAVRFLSCEPLLGPVDLRLLDYYEPDHANCSGLPSPSHEPACGVEQGKHWGIDWVIVGGESGPGARPMHPDWARGLRDQCEAAGVPFFFKQWGEWGPAEWKPERLDIETDEQYKARADAIGATHAHTGNPLPDGSHHIYEPPHRPWSGERGSLPARYAHTGIRRWGKKAAGRELDGRTWDDMPECAEVTA